MSRQIEDFEVLLLRVRRSCMLFEFSDLTKDLTHLELESDVYNKFIRGLDDAECNVYLTFRCNIMESASSTLTQIISLSD
jgi:hypothetical protein